jgi:hypothetical protein
VLGRAIPAIRRSLPPLVAYALVMNHDLGAIICAGCGSYAHPFLEACPICGVGRPSFYDAATAAPDQGFAALPSDPRVAREVAEVVLRYSLKFNAAPAKADLQQGLGTVGDALAYRVRVDDNPAAGSDRAHLEIGDADLVIGERNPARERMRVPLAAILAVSAAVRGRRADTWAGLAFEGRRERTSQPPLDGDLVVTHATPAGVGRISLGNRTGLLASRARSDHWTILVRWLGIVAAAAAERRWSAVGTLRHAHEIGLVAAPSGGWPTPVADDARATGPAGVADSLRLLDELRATGLMTDGEYAAKRREVLDRI